MREPSSRNDARGDGAGPPGPAASARTDCDGAGAGDGADGGDGLGTPDAFVRGTDEHYQDAALYDHEYKRRREDVRWYRDLAAQLAQDRPATEVPLRILELGCGTGRLLVPLARDGHHVVGVDRSQPMLARCRTRLQAAGRAARARAQLVRADFRCLPLGRPGDGPTDGAKDRAKDGADGAGGDGGDRERFPLILCPFNGFMHLYTRADVERFLAEVRRLLAPGGLLAFDVTNPDPTWLGRDPTRRWARTRFRHPHTGEPLVYSTSHVYDPETQIAWIRIYYERAEPAAPGRAAAPGDADGRATGPAAPARPLVRAPAEPAGFTLPRTVNLAHRQFYPAELEALLHYSGFSLCHRAGGFDGQPLSIVSSEQVICARVR